MDGRKEKCGENANPAASGGRVGMRTANVGPVEKPYMNGEKTHHPCA